MTETYTTILKNSYFSYQKKYCKIKIDANDLDTFIKIVEHLKALKELRE